MARLGQHRRQRHREAAGMRRRDQLLRIRALLVAEARAEAVAGVLEDALDRELPSEAEAGLLLLPL